jgi:hypothetical protein
LEVLGVHVAVGARPAIAPQAGEGSVVEVRHASAERATGFGLIPLVARLGVGVRHASAERATGFGLIPLVGFGLGSNESNAVVLATATGPNDHNAEQHERRSQLALAVVLSHVCSPQDCWVVRPPCANRTRHNGLYGLASHLPRLKNF